MIGWIRGGSLRIRLALFAAVAISVLLALAGLGSSFLFERYVERFVVGELTSHFEQLVAGLTFDDTGKLLSKSKLSDPRFTQPQGGMYWQVDLRDSPSLRSRSMWDESFAVPTPPEGVEENHAHVMPGPGGVEVLALERLVILPDATGKDRNLVITVAMERARVQSTVAEFGKSLLAGLAALYALLLSATLLVILLGLRPLKLLKASVEALRTGRTARIVGTYPEEVTPLVGEVNALVDAREKQLERARQRAGNLAHGLKTPLTVLAATASELAAQGQQQAASNIKLAAGQMRDLVDRELARSRMALADASHRAALRPAVERMVETLRRAPRGDAIAWGIDVPPDTHLAIDATDLLELLGNLVDNARKHARSQVRIRHDGQQLTVEDDGPGVPADKLQTIARRGVKLDALAAGSGLGLSIVSDLADVYDFDLTFGVSELGGLKATVGLPALN